MPMNFRRYPPWWDDNITLYNRDLKDDGTAVWYRKHLSGCYYQNPEGTQTSRMAGSDKLDTDTFVCRIRENENYRAPAEWLALDEAGKTSFFTLCTEDIIVPGHVADTIDESGNVGMRSSDLLEKYARAGAFRVSGALDSTGNLVGSPHYKATGVA